MLKVGTPDHLDRIPIEYYSVLPIIGQNKSIRLVGLEYVLNQPLDKGELVP